MTAEFEGVGRLASWYARTEKRNRIFITSDFVSENGRLIKTRYQLMAEQADCLIAFWNGKSYKTKKIIYLMQKLGKPIRIVRVEGVELNCAA